MEARPNFAKTKRGASGGFLPRPLLLRLRHPNSEKRNQPKFCGILSPENSFRKTSSALFPFHSLGFSAKWALTFSNKHHSKIYLVGPPGIEPGLPPYRGGVLPKHLQTFYRSVIPGGVEQPLSWLSPRRLRRWTTGPCFSSGVTGSRTRISSMPCWRLPVGP